MGLFGSNEVVGVEIGHASLRVVGLTVGKRPRLTGFAEVNIDPKALQKEALDSPTEVAAALKGALHDATPRSIKSRDAYLSIGEAAVFRKILNVPRDVTLTELGTVVRSAVVEFLPDEIDSLELDYQPLPTAKEAPEQQVMVVAVSKKSIEQYLNLCQQAGLRVVAIDPLPSALLRSAFGSKTTEPVVVVDIDTDISTLVLMAEHAVWVASTVTMGTNILIDPATGQVDEARKEEKLSRLVSSLADELDHVIKFYANRGASAASAVKEVRLVGGGASIPNLDALFAAETGRTVVLGQPPIPLPPRWDLRFMGALGSALYPLFEAL